MRSEDMSCRRGQSSPCGLSARIRVGDTPSIVTRCFSTDAHRRLGSGKSGAPSYITIAAPLAWDPTMESGPMIQPMSVNQ